MKSCVLLTFLLLAGITPGVVSTGSSEKAGERLEQGEIVLLDADSSEAGGSARVQALFQTSAESVWEVITSCESSFVFVDGLKKCRVIEDEAGRALVHQVVKKGWLIPKQDFVFESLRQPYHDIRFSQVEGSLKAMQGRWQLSETAGGLLVDYTINVRPKFPVPGFIVSWVMRRGMPDLIACIRGLAGGSGSPDRRNDDLERCRGEEKAPK